MTAAADENGGTDFGLSSVQLEPVGTHPLFCNIIMMMVFCNSSDTDGRQNP